MQNSQRLKRGDITGLATKAALNLKTSEVEVKIPDITNPATKSSLSTKTTKTENKIPNTTGYIIYSWI